VLPEKEILNFLPVGVLIRSFQLWTTTSHVISSRTRKSVGTLGLLEASMNPRCLKETISPGCGFHLFANSVVPAGATNRTPFGLIWKYFLVTFHNMLYYVQFTFPCA